MAMHTSTHMHDRNIGGRSKFVVLKCHILMRLAYFNALCGLAIFHIIREEFTQTR